MVVDLAAQGHAPAAVAAAAVAAAVAAEAVLLPGGAVLLADGVVLLAPPCCLMISLGSNTANPFISRPGAADLQGGRGGGAYNPGHVQCLVTSKDGVLLQQQVLRSGMASKSRIRSLYVLADHQVHL